MKRTILTVVAVAMACGLATAQTAPTVVPALINYEGELATASGGVLATGEYDLTFRIWSDPDDGSTAPANLLWVETYTSVPVVRGSFNVILGSGRPLPGFADRRDLLLAFTSPTAYLSVEVGTTDLSGEIRPRYQLLSAPYAIRALHAVPVGTVMPYVGVQTAPPEGWLYCDGAEIPATSQCAALRTHLSSQPGVGTEIYDPITGVVRTPDLRGRFLTGVSSAVQVGLKGGVTTHTHTVDIPPFLSDWHRDDYGHALIRDDDNVVRHHQHQVDPPATAGTVLDHRPPYLRLSFLIKL